MVDRPHDYEIRSPLPAMVALLLAACSSQVPDEPALQAMPDDPLVARALFDPLMVDPDLAYRNEANAAVSVRFDNPLPPMIASEEMASRARDATRLALLENGPITDLPDPSTSGAPSEIAFQASAVAIAQAAGAPTTCATQLEDDLIWSTRLGGSAAIIPHGLVERAAGIETRECSVQVARYLTPVAVEDALAYHFNIADRARLRPAYFVEPNAAIVAQGREEALAVFARPSIGRMTTVDIVRWSKRD